MSLSIYNKKKLPLSPKNKKDLDNDQKIHSKLNSTNNLRSPHSENRSPITTKFGTSKQKNILPLTHNSSKSNGLFSPSPFITNKNGLYKQRIINITHYMNNKQIKTNMNYTISRPQTTNDFIDKKNSSSGKLSKKQNEEELKVINEGEYLKTELNKEEGKGLYKLESNRDIILNSYYNNRNSEQNIIIRKKTNLKPYDCQGEGNNNNKKDNNLIDKNFSNEKKNFGRRINNHFSYGNINNNNSSNRENNNVIKTTCDNNGPNISRSSFINNTNTNNNLTNGYLNKTNNNSKNKIKITQDVNIKKKKFIYHHSRINSFTQMNPIGNYFSSSNILLTENNEDKIISNLNGTNNKNKSHISTLSKIVKENNKPLYLIEIQSQIENSFTSRSSNNIQNYNKLARNKQNLRNDFYNNNKVNSTSLNRSKGKINDSRTKTNPNLNTNNQFNISNSQISHQNSESMSYTENNKSKNNNVKNLKNNNCYQPKIISNNNENEKIKNKFINNGIRNKYKKTNIINKENNKNFNTNEDSNKVNFEDFNTNTNQSTYTHENKNIKSKISTESTIIINEPKNKINEGYEDLHFFFVKLIQTGKIIEDDF